MCARLNTTAPPNRDLFGQQNEDGARKVREGEKGNVRLTFTEEPNH